MSSNPYNFPEVLRLPANDQKHIISTKPRFHNRMMFSFLVILSFIWVFWIFSAGADCSKADDPELKVNCSIIFSCLKMFFKSNVWCSLRLLQLKTAGQLNKFGFHGLHNVQTSTVKMLSAVMREVI